MRILFFIVMLFLSCNDIEDRAGDRGMIKISYVGESDKLIRSIFITNDSNAVEEPMFVNVLYVENKTYKAVENFIKLNEVQAPDTTPDKESIDVIISIQNVSKVNKAYAFLSRKTGRVYLKHLIDSLVLNNDLDKQDAIQVIEHLHQFIQRINW